MPKKILIINSSANENLLLSQIFNNLTEKNFSFILLSSKPALLQYFRQKNWAAKKIFAGPDLNYGLKVLFFIVLLPLLQIFSFFRLLPLKWKEKISLLVCLSIKEKIIFTLPARLLAIKTVWLENPEFNYRRANKILLALYRLNFKLAKTGVFGNYSKIQLKNIGCSQEKIFLIPPAVKLPPYQENIFNKLAVNQANFHRKYFTIGLITALNQQQKIETIFQAIKICLPVIPNIQLIIVGEGNERKNLTWLAKKMGIENLVWLVGEQAQLKKWLDSFDVFLACGYNFKLDDYGNILEAMAAGLPVLAPRNIGLEDLVIENRTGALLEPDNSEMLARQIMKLHQDKKLRLFLGKNGRERVNNFFTISQAVAAMENIFQKS